MFHPASHKVMLAVKKVCLISRLWPSFHFNLWVLIPGWGLAIVEETDTLHWRAFQADCFFLTYWSLPKASHFCLDPSRPDDRGLNLPNPTSVLCIIPLILFQHLDSTIDDTAMMHWLNTNSTLSCLMIINWGDDLFTFNPLSYRPSISVSTWLCSEFSTRWTRTLNVLIWKTRRTSLRII